MEKEPIMVMKVLDRKTKQAIWIKEHRFNPEYHIKIKGENPQPHEDVFGDMGNVGGKSIVLDAMQAAVESGQKKREAELVEEVGVDESGNVVGESEEDSGTIQDDSEEDSEDEEISDEYSKLKMKDLRVLAEERSLKVPFGTSRKELLEMLRKA